MRNRDKAKKILRIMDFWTSAIVLATTVALLLFASFEVIHIFQDLYNTSTITIVHEVALIVILVKAYRILRSYTLDHHISIKYVLEISFIAPSIELIFAHSNQPLSVNILFVIFSLASLIIYIVYYDTLVEIQRKTIDD